MYNVAETEQIIEDACGELARGLFRLMEDGLYKEAYDTMDVIMGILMRDRDNLRKKGKV